MGLGALKIKPGVPKPTGSIIFLCVRDSNIDQEEGEGGNCDSTGEREGGI